MDDLTKGWSYKIGISIIPVFVPFFYFLFFGNIRAEPFQQAAGTGMYLFVVLAAENISNSFDRDQPSFSSPAVQQAFLTIIATLLWTVFIFVGLIFIPLSPANYLGLMIVIVLGLICGFPISKTNFRLYGLDYTEKTKQKQEQLEKRITKDPGRSARLEGKDIEL